MTFPDGTTGTGLVGSNGSYGPISSSTPQTNGTVAVVATDPAGNTSPPATTPYADTTAPTPPATPVVVANPDGTISISGGTGAGEPGSTVTVTFPDGTTGTGLVGSNGSYGPISSSTPQTNGTVAV
ncbi:Ig-like domain-containing protein, partial [Mesorhizobium japonicum]|uniref:Ig-like domain-containing protein n=1 Tax=Mesorhizobium japonicum TaxID=2066070 RepID=UPI003B5C2D23